MNFQTQLSLLLTSLIISSVAVVEAQDHAPRSPTAICSVDADSIRTLVTPTTPIPAANNSMSEKFKTIQSVMLYDHATARTEGKLKFKTTDTVVMIQNLPQYGGRAFNYATKETAQLLAITGRDARTGLEYFADVTNFEQTIGQVYVLRYQNYLSLPDQGMNLAVAVDERRQHDQLLARRVHLILGARDGQARAWLNCVDASGARYNLAGDSVRLN